MHNGVLRATISTEFFGAGETTTVGLRDASQLAGYSHTPHGYADGSHRSVLLKRHGLHVELVLDAANDGGSAAHASRPAGLVDVRVESALSAICDLEDSACTVDADDKIGAYRNWLGLMRRDLTADMTKAGTTTTRSLNGPRTWRDPNGGAGGVTLPGRALLLSRNGMLSRPRPHTAITAMATRSLTAIAAITPMLAISPRLCDTPA